MPFAWTLSGVSVILASSVDLDTDRIDGAALALLHLGLREGGRTWKAFDWNASEGTGELVGRTAQGRGKEA